jgi:uncharacterized membrane protein
MKHLNILHKEWNAAAYELINANKRLKTNSRVWKFMWLCQGMVGVSLAIAGAQWYVVTYAMVATFMMLRTVSEKHRLVGIYNERHRNMKIIDERFTKQVNLCIGEWYKIVDSEEFKKMQIMHSISEIFQRTLQREGIIKTHKRM